MSPALRSSVLVGLVCTIAACDSPAEPRMFAPGFNLDLRGSASDTVFAPPQPVSLRLLDSARAPVVGAAVQLSTRGTASVSASADPTLLTYVAPITDAAGDARFYIGRFATAGAEWVIARVVVGGVTWSDSLEITSLPGRATDVVMPVDTAVYQGNTLQWRGTVVDAYGNARPDAATYSAGSAGITIVGTTITANAAPSRQLVRATVGALRDSAWLSIVPRGVISVRKDDNPLVGEWVYARMELDGSGFQTLVPHTSPAFLGLRSAHPAPWFAGGASLAFAIDAGISRVDLTGSITPLLTAPGGGRTMKCPQITPDGQMLYGHIDNGGAAPGTAWRWGVGAGGADSVRISPVAGSGGGVFDLCPSPAPDRRYVAMISNRGQIDFFLHVVDTLTGTTTQLPQRGFPSVRWSPNGSGLLVSAWNGQLFVVSSNGTGYRTLGDTPNYTSWASFSPDAAWIAVERNGPVIDLINVQTGLVLPLGFTGYMRMPEWRR
ncbi:MAG: hypothetical protein IT357_07200 [Gemmatimonadaceae bacterium]|nr:hypothetical protein [Gemmatimonadaceae bacterium]